MGLCCLAHRSNINKKNPKKLHEKMPTHKKIIIKCGRVRLGPLGLIVYLVRTRGGDGL